jgi:YD repeat-containing protein
MCSPLFSKNVTVAATADRTNGVPAKRNRGTTTRGPASHVLLEGGRREGEVLVRFRLGLTFEQQRLIIASSGAKAIRSLRGESRVAQVILNAGQTIESVLQSLRSNHSVEFAEPNYLIHQDAIENSLNSTETLARPQSSIPNDPRFDEQWALQNLGGPTRMVGSDVQVTGLWQRSTGKRGVTIAVLDTGIDFTHPDLRNQKWLNNRESLDGRDEELDGFIDDVNGWNFVANNNRAQDDNGHGTNVAGIIAAEGNNGIGIAGVMWQAGLLSLKVLDANGVGDTANAIEAIDYAAAHGAQVINMSWGSDERSVFLSDAITRSSKHGVVVVCSAGNGSRDLDVTPYYPASFSVPNLVSVTASDAADNQASFSNFGVRSTTLAAPGVEILTTKRDATADDRSLLNSSSGYEVVSGTSASAAVVSGIVGLIKSLSFFLTAEQTKELLVRGARKVAQLETMNRAAGVVSGAGADLQSGPGGLGANRRGDSNQPGDAANPNKPDTQNFSRTNGELGSDGSGKNNRAGNRIKRRRGTPGPNLPNLDLQKSERPRLETAPDPVPSKKRNCLPSLPNCDGKRVPHPRWFRASNQGSLSNEFLVENRSPVRRSPVEAPNASNPSAIPSWFRQLLNHDDDAKWLPPMHHDNEENSAVAFFDSLDFEVSRSARRSSTNLSATGELLSVHVPTGPTVYQYVRDFYHGALARWPTAIEQAFWEDQLKDAKSLGSSSMVETAHYLGGALFLSSEYSASTNTDYVTDLYWAYLQRAPDSSGLSFWTGEANTYGREAVRYAFAESGEFSDLVTSVEVGTYPTTSGNFSTSRTDIVNRAGRGGEDLLSGNVNFSLPILALPGRAGLDLGLALTYNSRVWSKAGSTSGPTVAFDTDRGFPAPGFRLGFPVIHSRFYNSAADTASYLLITPGGNHIELRRVGSSSVYESVDSSYIQLTDNGSSLVAKTTDGTQMSYSVSNGQWVCTQIKDRNGNYITVNYNGAGNISSVVDTLARTITFNYDSNSHLQTITQTWTVGGSATTHTWATFSHDNKSIDTNFSGVYMLWPQDNTNVSVLTQVGFANGSHVDFEYNDYGQVNKVKRYASTGTGSLQSQTRYVFDSPSDDSPRVTDRYDWAKNWNGDTNGTVASGEEARTQFTTGSSSGVMTTPDNTIYKEFYGSSLYQRGLTTSTEVWVSSSKLKWTSTSWTQDNTSVAYWLNPRVSETNIYDAASNRRRTAIAYTDYGLPSEVTEYAADASTVYRKTLTEYVTASGYINNHVIGLPAKIEIKDVSNVLKSKTEFTYDSTGEHFTNVTGATQHDDTNYGSSFVTGRGNLTIATRYDLSSSATAQNKIAYNALGQVTFTRDASSHQTNFSYSESFSDGVNNRNTYAYPTTFEDPDENEFLTQYNFDFGGITRTEDPKGAVVTTAYDSIGRVDNTINVASSSDSAKRARTRFEYGPDYVITYVRGFDNTNEAYTNTQFDGAGRKRAVATDFPGSTGGYKASYTSYDIMGRVSEQTNSTETNSSWAAAGDDSGGFASSLQTYDWKGRPLVTTNQDDTTKSMSYSGCGCAGGEVVTLTDEVGRKQMVYADSFGRSLKTEIFSDASTVNSTSVTTYDVLDQVTQVREYSGNDSSSTYQDTTLQYDGYGRLWKTHKPEFDSSTYNTITYNSDDTLATATDPRGVVTTYSYNGRHLPTQISYTVPSGLTSTVPATPTATFTYDSVGNRLTASSSVSSVTHVYDTASRMTSETRSFNGVSGDFTLTYGYNAAGGLTSIQDAFSATVGYSYDKTGQLTSVGASGSGFPSVSSFVSSMAYRAWGAPKSMAYSNTVTESAAFNERMQPTSYTMAWAGSSSLATTYDYYDDGRVNHAYSWDAQFDRKYDYDFAARLKEAYTNREARGLSALTPSVDPYRQSLTYDAFGNQTARTGKLWSHSMSDSGSFINNRRSTFTYDAAGHVVYDSGSYSFDAAGQSAQSISSGGSFGDTYYHSYEATITINRDSDGTPVKRTQYIDRWDGVGDDPITESEETIVTYSLPSSVVGSVIDEIDGSGAKTKGNIYAGTKKIAEQDVTSSTNAVRFQHSDPVSGSSYETNESGGYSSRTEYDPLSAVLPTADPYQSELGPPTYADLVHAHEQLYFNGGDPYDYSGGCTSFGSKISCADANRYLQMGFSVAMVNGIRTPNGGLLVYIHCPADDGVGPRNCTVTNVVPIEYKAGDQGTMGKAQKYAQERSDLKADRKQMKNQLATPPRLTPCVTDYLSKFFDRSMLEAITWDRGIPWYVPMQDARAFTLNDMIYFGDREYDPLNGISDEELTLIAHEVTHSRQYRQNGSLRFKAKYLIQGAVHGGVGALEGTAAHMDGLAWEMSYYGNKYEIEAETMEKKIAKDIEQNGNPCK